MCELSTLRCQQLSQNYDDQILDNLFSEYDLIFQRNDKRKCGAVCINKWTQKKIGNIDPQVEFDDLLVLDNRINIWSLLYIAIWSRRNLQKLICPIRIPTPHAHIRKCSARLQADRTKVHGQEQRVIMF